MFSLIKKSVFVTIALVIILCAVYPFAVWVVGQVAFKEKANGSLIEQNGQVIGSRLIAQAFTKPEYFHPRPSAAGSGYDAASSSGSNLAMTNKKFLDGVEANVKTVLAENPTLKKGEVPNDMVTASASGLDPHISPENALAQADRVASARQVSVENIKALIETFTDRPTGRLLGDPTVNVLELNLELDRAYAKK